MNTNAIAIKVRDLVYEYPGHRALNHVSFDILKGSVTALVGPNGAGKTTLMSCLAALKRPFSGHLEVDGVNILEQPREGHRHIGYLKDFFGLYDALTVKQTLWHAARGHNITPNACPATIDRVMAQLDLSGLAVRRASALSRGQRQRLAIARALVHQPPVLLLDEPASGLDPQARHRLALLMRKLSADGITLLVSSHILAELEEYSTHLMILRGGRLLEQRALQVKEGPKRLRMTFLTPPDETPQFITHHPQIDHITLNGQHMMFTFNGNESEQAQFLRQCIVQDLKLSAFAPREEGLQDEYLRHVEDLNT